MIPLHFRLSVSQGSSWALNLQPLLLPLITSAQVFKRKVNTSDENGKRQGLWLSYWDEEEKTLMTKYHFKNGHETYICKEFHSNGKTRLKFRYYKNRIRVKYFDENKQLTQKGWAKWNLTEKDLHYYWEGKWKFYDEKKKLIRVEIWELGELKE